MRSVPALLLAVFLAAVPARGQTTAPAVPAAPAAPAASGSAAPPAKRPPAEVFPPRDDAEEAVLGVAEFRLLGGGFRDRFLGRNVARLLAEKVSEIGTHYISDAERDSHAAGIAAAARRKILKNLDDVLGRRSALLFSGASGQKTAGSADLDAEAAAAREKLGILDRLVPADIPVRREKRLKAPAPSADGETLLLPVMHPAAAAAKAGADYLLYGTVEQETEGYFTATAYLYGAAAGMGLSSARATGSYEETDTVVRELFLNLAAAVAGRPWAVLEIGAEPRDAGVFADGVLIGIGKGKLAYVPPGTYRIEVAARGYETREENVTLAPFAMEERRFELPPLEARLLTLASEPPGADVYLGSVRLGSTPLEIPLDRPRGILRLEAEGHRTKAVSFPPPGGGDAEFHILPRDIFTWEERIESKRKSFYRAFGWFVLSLPVPILLNGWYQNEVFGYLQYTTVPAYDADRARGMVEKADFLYYSYFGSLFVSGSLLVNAVQKLIDYIRTGEESQRFPERSRKD